MGTQYASNRKIALPRRGRAGVFWALGVFLALQLGFHYPLARWFPYLNDMEYGKKFNSLRAQLQVKRKDQPLIVALGSSLTGMAVQPTALTTCLPNNSHGALVYNYAINSGSIVVQQLCLRRLLAEGIHPDWVLVEVYPPFFLESDQTNPMRVERFPSVRAHWQDLAVLDRYVVRPQQFRQDWREAQRWPWHFRRHMLQNWLVPSWIASDQRSDHLWNHTDAWGWETMPAFLEKVKPTYDTPAFVADTRKVMADWNQRPISEHLDTALRDFLDLCQREKIGVVLIWVPESSHFRSDYSPALLQRINHWHACLSRDKAVAIVSARDWLADPDFIDGLHVTPEGATHYTQRLESEVIQPLLTGTMSSSGPIAEIPPHRNIR